MAGSRRSPIGTGAPLAGSAAVSGTGVERVGRLIAGEAHDTSTVPYEFELEHVGIVVAGSGAEEFVEERVGAVGGPHLVVGASGGLIWAWVGGDVGATGGTVESLFSPQAGEDLRVAVGEPASGLAGWRLTHHQARAALGVALRGHLQVVRYAEVAVLASLLRDELLAGSLRRIYLEPLETGRNGSGELRHTLHAYFQADRNLSLAGANLGVTRQAVARRLRAAEELLDRPLAECALELELALRLDALEAAPRAA